MPQDNVTKISAFVDGHIAFAEKKTPRAAASHLEHWSAWLRDQINHLGGKVVPDHLVGVTLEDLDSAATRLDNAAHALAVPA